MSSILDNEFIQPGDSHLESVELPCFKIVCSGGDGYDGPIELVGVRLSNDWDGDRPGRDDIEYIRITDYRPLDSDRIKKDFRLDIQPVTERIDRVSMFDEDAFFEVIDEVFDDRIRRAVRYLFI